MAYETALLSTHTGAEVRGIDLRTLLDAVTSAALNRAFVEHSVLVFRDQHLSPAELLAPVRSSARCFRSTTQSSRCRNAH
jgi:taurine dioxygenase